MNPPPLIELSEFSGSWALYSEHLYQVFLKTLVNADLKFKGLRISYQFRPAYDGKHFGFWHLISQGDKEEDREPDFRRCERIGWISWMITNAYLCSNIRVVKQKRRGMDSAILWEVNTNYMVVFHLRKDFWLLKTAYLAKSNKVRELNRLWKEQGSING